jgi:hypothetical protein
MKTLALTVVALPVLAGAAWFGFCVVLLIQLSRSKDFVRDGRFR